MGDYATLEDESRPYPEQGNRLCSTAFKMRPKQPKPPMPNDGIETKARYTFRYGSGRGSITKIRILRWLLTKMVEYIHLSFKPIQSAEDKIYAITL